MDAMQECMKSVAQALAGDKESVLLAAIRLVSPELPNFTIGVMEQYKNRGRFEIYPDKTEVFVWDGKPLIKFYPIKIDCGDSEKCIVSQYYQLLIGGAND